MTVPKLITLVFGYLAAIAVASLPRGANYRVILGSGHVDFRPALDLEQVGIEIAIVASITFIIFLLLPRRRASSPKITRGTCEI